MTSLRSSSFSAPGAALAMTIALAACGGGGRTGPDFQVTFGQPSVVVSTFDDVPVRSGVVEVTISPAPGPSDVVRVEQTGTAFDLAGMTVMDNGGGHYLADLPVPGGLAAGTYAGTLTLRICRDAACAQPYTLSTSTLPYSVIVAHRAAAGQVTYDVPQVFDTAWDDETGRSAVLLFSVTPPPTVDPTVEVLDGAGLFALGTAFVGRQPDGNYAAFIDYPDSVAAGTYSGDVTLRICQDAACTVPYGLPQATVPYDVMVHHVEAGLPPLTATFTVGGAATTDVNEAVNGLGERTYAVAAQVGQVLEMTMSEAPISLRRPITGTTATLALDLADHPVVRFQITEILGGASSGVAFLNARVADGRWLRLTVNATP